jgi:aminoglycoside phosphotransferase (APT) family kinase protein
MADAFSKPDPLARGDTRRAKAVIRIGDTVRYPLHDRFEQTIAVLEHLEAAGFDGAPRVLAIDLDRQDMVLSYLKGRTVSRVPARLSDKRLIGATSMIRRFHDATQGTSLAQGHEIVCHSDLGPHNIIFDRSGAVGIIDWDGVHPGSRLFDFAHAAWCCADICTRVPVPEQARKLNLMCNTYGWDDPWAVIEEIAARFMRAHAQHSAEGRPKAARIFERMANWMHLNGTKLKTLCPPNP